MPNVANQKQACFSTYYIKTRLRNKTVVLLQVEKLRRTCSRLLRWAKQIVAVLASSREKLNSTTLAAVTNIQLSHILALCHLLRSSYWCSDRESRKRPQPTISHTSLKKFVPLFDNADSRWRSLLLRFLTITSSNYFWCTSTQHFTTWYEILSLSLFLFDFAIRY